MAEMILTKRGVHVAAFRHSILFYGVCWCSDHQNGFYSDDGFGNLIPINSILACYYCYRSIERVCDSQEI